jgi:hypothetical protein
MTGVPGRAVLRPGDWVSFDGDEHQVLALAGTSVRLRAQGGAEQVVLASYLMAAPDFAVTGGASAPGVASLTRLRDRGRCYSPIRHFAANPRLLSIPLSSRYMIISWMSLYDRNVILAG